MKLYTEQQLKEAFMQGGKSANNLLKGLDYVPFEDWFSTVQPSSEIKEAINSIFDKIVENGCEAWEDNLEETKSVIPIEKFRGVKYNGWFKDLTTLKNKL
jgi:hypothetical protein